MESRATQLEGTEESYPIFPVFMLVDVSSSMTGPVIDGVTPIEAVNQTLPELKQLVEGDPTVGEIARVGIIAFSKSAVSELDLSDVKYVEMPRLTAGGSTNFAEAFRTTKTVIESSIGGLGKGTRFYKPVVFFLSDGHHVADEDWKPARAQLTDRDFKFNPEIVAFGFGEADEGELRQIATRYAFMTKDLNPVESVREIVHTIIGSIRTTSRSLGAGTDGGLTMEPDPNKFTALPVMTVDD